MMMTKSQTRPDFNREIAYHEAGHAVSCWAAGLRIDSVSIVPNAKTGGRVTLKDWRGLDNPSIAVPMYYAATAAVAKLLGQPIGWHGPEDRAAALKLCNFRSLQRHKRTARVLVELHWSKIKLIADLLLKHRKLRGEFVEQVLNAQPEPEPRRKQADTMSSCFKLDADAIGKRLDGIDASGTSKLDLAAMEARLGKLFRKEGEPYMPPLVARSDGSAYLAFGSLLQNRSGPATMRRWR
jgi:hypothetical protein